VYPAICHSAANSPFYLGSSARFINALSLFVLGFISFCRGRINLDSVSYNIYYRVNLIREEIEHLIMELLQVLVFHCRH
jgi:hypothetical protein